MSLSVFDIFKIGIGPSSSHTMGPMNAARSFVELLEARGLLDRTTQVSAQLYGSLALTGRGHCTDRAILLGLEGLSPDTIDSTTVEPAAPACWTEVSGLPKFGFVLLACARFSAPEVENKARNTNPINTTAVASTRNALLRSMLFCPRVLISARFGRLRSSWIRRQICCTMPPVATGPEAALVSGSGSSALAPSGFTRLVMVGSSCSISSRSCFSSRMQRAPMKAA